MYRTRYTVGGPQTISTAVVFAVCSVTGDDPREAPSLSEVIDTDSLDRLFDGTQLDEGGDRRITFTYDGRSVTVDREGWITVTPGDVGPNRPVE